MKQWPRWFSLVAVALLVLVGCAQTDKADKIASQADERPFLGKTLNVVATSDKYVELFNKFTEQTGAKVEFLSMSSGEVISRTKAEGKPMADVWFGGGLDAFLAADQEGLLEHYQSPNATAVDAAYKDKDGAWIAKGLTVAGFLVNNGLLEEKGLPVPKTWADLTKPEYRGLISMSNPAISGTNYAVMKGLLDAKGEKAGWQYFEDLNKNIEFYSKRGKDPQEKTVQGEFAIGIIPIDNSAFEVAKDNNLTVVYPDQIPWVPEGMAIFKGSQNVAVAKAFEDFMLTKEAQAIIAQVDGKDTAQIVVPEVEGLSLGLPKEHLIKEDLSTFGTERENILAHFKTIAADKAEE